MVEIKVGNFYKTKHHSIIKILSNNFFGKRPDNGVDVNHVHYEIILDGWYKPISKFGEFYTTSTFHEGISDVDNKTLEVLYGS